MEGAGSGSLNTSIPARPTTGSAPSVTVNRLVKRFGKFVAVDEVSFETMPGEIFGFLGPNGSGKSTTIRMLCGLLRPSSGRASVAGIDVAAEPEAVRQQIGYMSQRFSLYQDLTVRENLRFFGGMYGVSARDLAARISWAVAMAGLDGRESTLARELAGGWRQRLALGCAVLHRPPIVFLDEPTSGVDPMSRRHFWQIIHQMSDDGVTVFVTTHYMEEAEYCNRLALIARGRIVALGQPSELRHRFATGALLRVECAPLGEAAEAARSAPGVIESAIFGNGLHLTAEKDLSIEGLAQYLAARGIHVLAIERIGPTLGDVFVSVTRDRADTATRGH